jgi:hypothetical protein
MKSFDKFPNWECYLLHGLPLFYTPEGEYYAIILDNGDSRNLVIMSKFPMDRANSLTIKLNEKI